MVFRGAARSPLPGSGTGCPNRPGRLGRLYRHNQLWREVYGLSGALLEEQYLCANDAIMMYSPLLSAAPADGE